MMKTMNENKWKRKTETEIEQNALPSWHSNSTVGQSNTFGKLEDEEDDHMGTPSSIKEEGEQGEANTDSKEIYGSDSKEGTTEQSSVMATPEPQSTVNNNSNFNNVSAELKRERHKMH